MSDDTTLTRGLTAADFGAFYRAVHGRDPFPWQARLVTELATGQDFGGRDGQWPHLLDLPTGTGKTTAIEIAVFLMALRDDAPRRVVFVVDRRVVVQQAFTVALQLASRLADAESDRHSTGVSADGVLTEVARRLRRLCAGAPRSTPRPIVVAELRGGIDIDETWSRRPDVPTVLVSTVDQVGSRLLMQGYGVSPRMRPVHAGLLANDVLFLLDEVHLARPFAQTLTAVGRFRHVDGGVWGATGDRWQVSRLSATPGADTGAVGPAFTLDDDDRSGPLQQRLAARKPARCVPVKTPADEVKSSTALAKAMVREAMSLHGSGQATVITVIANRVATATAVADGLRSAMGDVADSTVVLLTGRMRPYDRDALMRRFGPRLSSGRTRASSDEPLFLVGTQAVEAGADFDADVLVTECASLDALKQRFGRVDRLGLLSETGRTPVSVVLAPERIDKEPDPVYGTAMAETWQWLRGLDAVDFGVDHLSDVPIDLRERLLSPARNAPALMSSHLDRWWQSTEPDAVPDVADWLHGAQDQDPDVTVIWRLGLNYCAGASGRGDATSEVDADTAVGALADLMAALPPTSAEGVTVPVARVRRWLTGSRSAALFADVEGLTAPDDAQHSGTHRGQVVSPWLIWRPEAPRWTSRSGLIRPGDTVVVDATRGGLRALTWDPTSADPVTDVALAVASADHERAPDQVDDDTGVHCVRLLPEAVTVGSIQAASVVPPTPQTVVAQEDVPADDRVDPEGIDQAAVVRAWCHEVAEGWSDVTAGAESDLGQLAWLVRTGRLARAEVRVLGAPGHSWYLVRYAGRATAQGDVNIRPAVSSATGGVVTLDQHLRDTATWAQAFVTGAGVTSPVATAVVEAARWHDLGKVDDRFQRQLRDGRVVTGSGLLAKSMIPSWDRQRWERARRDAGYPRGERHEMFSVQLLKQVLPTAEGDDAELVRHLVATHHGSGRPFVRPASADGAEVGVVSATVLGRSVLLNGPHGLSRDDSPVPERFWQVIRRFGWFATAWLESLVRLADHRASEFPGTAVEVSDD